MQWSRDNDDEINKRWSGAATRCSGAETTTSTTTSGRVERQHSAVKRKRRCDKRWSGDGDSGVEW